MLRRRVRGRSLLAERQALSQFGHSRLLPSTLLFFPRTHSAKSLLFKLICAAWFKWAVLVEVFCLVAPLRTGKTLKFLRVTREAASQEKNHCLSQCSQLCSLFHRAQPYYYANNPQYQPEWYQYCPNCRCSGHRNRPRDFVNNHDCPNRCVLIVPEDSSGSKSMQAQCGAGNALPTWVRHFLEPRVRTSCHWLGSTPFHATTPLDAQPVLKSLSNKFWATEQRGKQWRLHVPWAITACRVEWHLLNCNKEESESTVRCSTGNDRPADCWIQQKHSQCRQCIHPPTRKKAEKGPLRR